MYAQPVTRRMRAHRLLLVIAVVGVLAGALLMVDPGTPEEGKARMAAIGPKIVSGHVYLSGGTTPAVGAMVVATSWDGLSLRGASLPDTTDSSGFYSVTLGPSDWDVGNLVVVAATLDSAVGEGNVVADDAFEQSVNLVMGTEVPEFGAPFVLLVVGVVAVALVMGRGRSR